jgi:hypothetical protein
MSQMLKSLVLKYFSALLSTSALAILISSTLNSRTWLRFWGPFEHGVNISVLFNAWNNLTSCDIVTAQRELLLHSGFLSKAEQIKKNVLVKVGPHQSPQTNCKL